MYAIPTIDTLCWTESQLGHSESTLLRQLKASLRLVAHPVTLVLPDFVPGRGATMVFANAGFAELSGYSLEETVGKNTFMLGGMESSFQGQQETHVQKERVTEYFSVLHTKHGERRILKTIAKPVFLESGKRCFFVLTHEDITELAIADQGKAMRDRIIGMFRQIKPFRDACQEVLHFIVRELKFVSGSLWLLSEGERQLNLAVMVTDPIGEQAEICGNLWPRLIRLGEGFIGEAWKTGEIQEWQACYSKQECFWEDQLKEQGIQSVYAIPLRCELVTEGILVLSSALPSFHDSLFRELFNLLAETISNKVQKIKLELKYDSLFNQSVFPVIILSNDLVIRSVNPVFAHQLEEVALSVIGTSFLDLLRSEKRAEGASVFSALKESLCEKKYVCDIMLSAERSLTISWNISRISGSRAFLLTGKDLTSLGEVMDSLKQSQKQTLAHTKQLRDIAWAQSHKVRAPLANIMGLVQLLSSSTGLSENESELLELLQHASMNLDAVVREISTNANLLEGQQLMTTLLG